MLPKAPTFAPSRAATGSKYQNRNTSNHMPLVQFLALTFGDAPSRKRGPNVRGATLAIAAMQENAPKGGTCPHVRERRTAGTSSDIGCRLFVPANFRAGLSLLSPCALLLLPD